MSAAQRVVVIAGPKGSGKSTLIKALFPELPVRFAEPFLYRVYETSKGCRVVEVQAKDEALRVLLAAPPWKISVGIVLVDATQQVAVNPLVASLFAEAPAKALVLSKAEQASADKLREAQKEAERLGMEFFAVSAVSRQGIEELLTWIQTGDRPKAVPPAPAVAPPPPSPPGKPPIPVDLVPVPSGKEPRRGELSEEELSFLRACDGKRGLGEIASTLGLPYGKAKSIADKLFSTGYLKELRVRSQS